MMHRGYIKLWRSSLDDEMIKNHKLWAFWTWCLLRANHKKRSVFVGYAAVPVAPGEFIFGRKTAAHELGMTEGSVRTCLKNLKKAKKITIKTTNRFSILSIVNWDSYQDGISQDNQQDNQPVTSKQPANDQQTTTDKNEKNEKNGKNEKKTSAPAAIAPERIVEKAEIDYESEINSLLAAYNGERPDIEAGLEAVAVTRNRGRIADSVRLSILKKLAQYAPAKVVAGIRTYIDKGYHLSGKKEDYLFGIIRNQVYVPATIKRQPADKYEAAAAAGEISKSGADLARMLDSITPEELENW